MKYYYYDENDESFVVYEGKDGLFYPVFAERYGEKGLNAKENMPEVYGKKEIEALDKYMDPYIPGKKNIYMAGPLFNEGDRYTNQINSDKLRLHGYSTFLPQEVVIDKDSSKLVKDACFYMDFKAIRLCQIVVANCNGIEVDSGTAAEIGMCYAMGKIIFAYKSDVRNYYNETYKLNNFVGGLVGNKTYADIDQIISLMDEIE